MPSLVIPGLCPLLSINNPVYESIVPGRTFPCTPLPTSLTKKEEQTFTPLTGHVFVHLERQCVCPAGGKLEVEVCLSGIHEVEDLADSGRQTREMNLLRMLPAGVRWMILQRGVCCANDSCHTTGVLPEPLQPFIAIMPLQLSLLLYICPLYTASCILSSNTKC